MTRPIVDERLAEHARACEVIQDRHREKYRTEDLLPEEKPAADPQIIRRILHGYAVPPFPCWRY